MACAAASVTDHKTHQVSVGAALKLLLHLCHVSWFCLVFLRSHNTTRSSSNIDLFKQMTETATVLLFIFFNLIYNCYFFFTHSSKRHFHSTAQMVDSTQNNPTLERWTSKTMKRCSCKDTKVSFLLNQFDPGHSSDPDTKRNRKTAFSP